MRCWDLIDPWCLQDHVQPVVSSTSRCLHAHLSSWFIWPSSRSGLAIIFFSQTMNNVLQSPLWSINYGLWLRGVVTSCLVDDPAIISWTMNPFQPSTCIHTQTILAFHFIPPFPHPGFLSTWSDGIYCSALCKTTVFLSLYANRILYQSPVTWALKFNL